MRNKKKKLWGHPDIFPIPHVQKKGGPSWYIRHLDRYTNEVLARMLPDSECCEMVCADGKSRHFWSVIQEEIWFLERSRRTDHQLHFELWYVSAKGGGAKLRKSDDSYRRHKTPRGTLMSLTDGNGRRVPFPVRVPVRKQK
jgi:hypothetical protein